MNRTATAGEKRTSQSPGSLLNNTGGLGYLARRGVDNGTSILLQTPEGVARLAATQPLQFITLLADFVPEISLALWNDVNIGCTPASVRLKAVTKSADGASEEAPEGTAALDALFANQPDEVGDLHDMIEQNYQMNKFSGMCAVEAVPGPRMSGLEAIFPINTLTLRFRRENNGALTLYQRQIADPNGVGVYSVGMSGAYTPLPMERVFYAKLNGLPDEPYGRAPMAPALTVVIDCLTFLRDLAAALHRVGYPFTDIGFDFDMFAKYAQDNLGLTDPKDIDEYVQKCFANAVQLYNDKRVDDAYFHDLKSVVNIKGSGGAWPDIVALWGMMRLRLVQAIKSLPALLGIIDGDTETWSKVQWDIYTSGLMTCVGKAVKPITKAGNLHLQLLGMPFACEAEITPPRSIQRLDDATAEAQEINNETRKRDEGLQTQETTAMKITGSAPVAEPRSWQQEAENKNKGADQDKKTGEDSQ